MQMEEKTIPWWRKVLSYALGGIRSGFALFSRPQKNKAADLPEIVSGQKQNPEEDIDLNAHSPNLEPIAEALNDAEPVPAPETAGEAAPETAAHMETPSETEAEETAGGNPAPIETLEAPHAEAETSTGLTAHGEAVPAPVPVVDPIESEEPIGAPEEAAERPRVSDGSCDELLSETEALSEPADPTAPITTGEPILADEPTSELAASPVDLPEPAPKHPAELCDPSEPSDGVSVPEAPVEEAASDEESTIEASSESSQPSDQPVVAVAPEPAAEPAGIPIALPAAEPVQEPAPPQQPIQKQLIKLETRDNEADLSPFSVIVAQVYDGPLDLLLDLIRKQDIDIYDIPIARITAQFLAYVNQLKATDVDVAGEFIYTASLLIHIKSKMLLPRAPAGPEDAAEDPRRELVERLLEHERFKNAAQMLQQKQMLEAATWTNPGLREFQDDTSAEPEIAADTVDLVRIFRDILERARNRPVINVEEDSVTVGQMIQFLARRLTMEDKPVALRRLLSHTRSERALIAMFLALLELVRLQAILLRQDRAFSEIFIKKHTGFDARDE